MSLYVRYPSNSSTVPVYSTFSAFPASAADGALAVAADTDVLYVFNVGMNAWLPLAAPGSALSIGMIDSTTASSNGAAINVNQLIMQSASGTVPGLVNLTTQTFLGQKTFTTGLTGTLTGHASLDVAISTLGNLTDAGTDGIVVTGGTGAVVGSVSLAQHVADTTHNGYLSSTDWNTFNSKQSTLTIGNFTDAGTDGITVTGGTGAVIGSGTSIAQHVADTTHNGYLSSTDWNTFNNKQSTLTLGNLTDVGTDGITIIGGTGAVVGSGTSISQHVADTTHSGYLSSTDWNTFNGKQAAGNYITALTGDVTATGPGSVASTVAKIAGTTVSGTTGSTNVVFSNSPALVTPAIGAATGSSLSVTGQLTSTVATGTAPLVVSSTTQVANLNAATAGTATNATNVATTAVSNNASYFPLMAASSSNSNQAADLATTLTFNPSTNALSTTTFVGALTGTASGNTTYTANNHGVVISGSGNTMTVIAPDASITKVLTSGGASADPTWAAITPGVQTFTTQTGNYTVAAGIGVVLCNTNAFTVTLPAASTNSGRQIIIQKIGSDTNQITVARAGSDTINGATSTTLATQYDAITLISDGSATWCLVERTYPESWTSYTPTGSWVSNVTYTGMWRRNGDSMEVQAQVACTGAPTAATLTINLPTGYTIDTTKLLSTADTNFNPLAGSNVSIVQTGTQGYEGVVLYSSTTAVQPRTFNLPSGTAITGQVINATTPFTFANTHYVAMYFQVPITGWVG